MASISCCKAGASLPSDPSKPFLIFLSTSNVDGTRICLQLVLRGTWCSTGTKGALLVSHTLTIKSVRAFKNIKSVLVSSIHKQHTFTWGLMPLLYISFNEFFQSQQSKISTGRI